MIMGVAAAPSARAATHDSVAAQHNSAPTASAVAVPVPSLPIPGLPSGSAGTAPQVSPEAMGQKMQAAITSASPGTRVGIDVLDTATGATIADRDSAQQFYTASVVKLLIALDKLNSQGWRTDPATTAQLQQMLSASDDDIADRLWVADGRGAIVTRMAGLMRLTGTRAPSDPGQWGETLTTAKDVVTVYRYLTSTVPQPARDVIMTGLRGAKQTAADGTDQYFGIPDGLTGADWAVKQGWMSLNDSTTMDTTGLVGAGAGQPLRYVVVVLSSQPAGISWTTGGNALTAGVRVLHGTVD